MSMQPEAELFSRRALLIFYYKYRKRLILALVIPLALSLLIAAIVTPRYNAQAVLIVRLGAEYVYNPEVSDSRDGTSNLIPFDLPQIFKSEVAILGSDDLRAATIKAIGLEKLFPELDGVMYRLHKYIAGLFDKDSADVLEEARLPHAVEIFGKRLDIMLEKDSAVITVSFENRDPAMAVAALDTLLKLYMQKRKAIYLEPRAALAKTEMGNSYQKTVTAEHAVQEFKRRHKIYSLAGERELLLENRDKALEQASVISDAGLEKRIADYNLQLDKLDSLERDFNVLQKEAQIARESYSLYSRKYDEAKAYEDLERQRLDSVRVIQAPVAPYEPSRIRLWIVLAGVFLSAVSVFATAAVTNFMKDSFHSGEEVKNATGLPVLASFVQSPEKEKDAMRNLIHAISTREKTARIITFISARLGEGTSDIAWNYALRLAENTGQKVLLLADGLIALKYQRRYGFIPGAGILDAYMEGGSLDEAVNDLGNGLSVCCFIQDEEKYNRVGIINSSGFWKGVLELYSHVIIDAKPLQVSQRGVLMAANSDLAAIVIEAERTPAAVVRNLCDKLLSYNVEISGVVINRRRHYIPEKIYRNL